MTKTMLAGALTEIDEVQSKIHSVCGRYQLNPTEGSGPVMARFGLERTGGLDVARIGLTADRVERGPRDIKHDPGGYFFLVVQQAGRVEMENGESRCPLAPGDMYLVDSDQPSRFDFQGRYAEQLSVHLPREDMLRRFGRRIHGGIAIGRREPLGIAMRSVLLRLLTGEAAAGGHLSEAFFGVLGAYLADLDQGGRCRQSDADILLAAALREISLRFQDPDFGPSELADLLGVSMRTLQRAFSRIDETPRQRLLTTRLEHARAALLRMSRNPTNATIGAVVYEQGFNDLSHFYKEFQKHYGVTPGKLLRSN